MIILLWKPIDNVLIYNYRPWIFFHLFNFILFCFSFKTNAVDAEVTKSIRAK